MVKKLVEVDKFKELILDMYRGFPSWRYRGMIESIITTQEDRTQLIQQGFLIREKTDQGYQYSLGPNSLPLVSAWKTEQLTKEMRLLTWAVLVLSVLMLINSMIEISR